MKTIFGYQYLLSCILIFFSISISSAQNIENVDKKFNIFLEKEFLLNNIKTKSDRYNDNFIILGLDKTEYLVSFRLLKKNYNQDFLLIPTLKIVRKEDGISFGLSRSITFEKNSNLLEIETVSKMLVNDVIKQLKKNGLKFNIINQKQKDITEKKLQISINYFNSCESNEIIEIMEKQFPGFIHLESYGLSNSSTNKILYYTTSTKYKVKKWIERILYQFGFSPKDFFIKIYKNKIDVTKSDNTKIMFSCE